MMIAIKKGKSPYKAGIETEGDQNENERKAYKDNEYIQQSYKVKMFQVNYYLTSMFLLF